MCQKNSKYIDKPLEQVLQQKLNRTVWLLHELNKHREGQAKKSNNENSQQEKEIELTAEESALISREQKEVLELNQELERMRDRQIQDQQRQRIEHAELIGAHKLEHEKRIFLRNAKLVQTTGIDQILQNEGVAKVTGMPIDDPKGITKNHWDSWRYREQQYGPILTSSQKPDAEFIDWRSKKEYCDQFSIKQEEECIIMTLDEYFAQ